MAKKKKATGLLPSQNYRRKVFVGYRSDGTKREESFTAPTAAEAEAMAAAFRVRVRQLRREGVAVEDITREGEAVRSDTVQKHLDLYAETCRLTGLSPSTVLSYDRIIRRCYGPLRSAPVSSLTIPMIQNYANERVAAGASAKTIRCELSLLSCAIRQARPDLNMSLVRIPRQTRREIAIPSTDQVRRMIAAAADTPLYIPLILAALMGLRRSEICALTWSDVDLKKNTLRVRSAVVRGEAGTYQTKAPKTQAGNRVLPVPSAVARALAASRTLDPKVTPLTPDAVTRRFERLLEKLQMSFRFHDLRHFHASVMISVGAPDKYITADMGHASMDMVRRVYGHVMADRQREINSQMEAKANEFLG